MTDHTKPLLIVVDDERDMAEIVGHVGETVGFGVRIATSAAEFKQVWRERKPDAIVMDIIMPDMDANELIEWVIGNDKTVPIILDSGYGDMYLPSVKALANARGANIIDTLTKPIDFERLEAAFKKVLGRD